MDTGVPPPFVISFINEKKGRGMFASRSFKQEETLFFEQPIISQQHVTNRLIARTCGNCFRFLGTLEEQLAHHRELLEMQSLPIHNASGIVRCVHECGELYCSEECRNEALFRHHNILCVGTLQVQEHPLFQFKSHAILHNELFLLAGQVLAVILSSWRLNGGQLNQHVLPFAQLHKKLWWEVVTDVQEDILKSIMDESLKLLRQAFVLQLRPEEYQFLEFLRVDFFATLLGLLDLNNHTIDIKAPLQIVYSSLAEQGTHPSGLTLEVLKPIAEAIAREQDNYLDEDEAYPSEGCSMGENYSEPHLQDIFPAFEGLGIFPNIAMMNHSCVPNANVRFGDDRTAVVVALRDIQPGEELTISYIENDMPLEARQKELQEYGFICDCPLCSQQAIE